MPCLRQAGARRRCTTPIAVTARMTFMSRIIHGHGFTPMTPERAKANAEHRAKVGYVDALSRPRRQGLSAASPQAADFTILFRSTPICGEPTSTTSPTFKKRSGASTPSPSVGLEILRGSGPGAATDDIARVEREIPRQKRQTFAERKHHVAAYCNSGGARH